MIIHQPRFSRNKKLPFQKATIWGETVVWGRDEIWPALVRVSSTETTWAFHFSESAPFHKHSLQHCWRWRLVAVVYFGHRAVSVGPVIKTAGMILHENYCWWKKSCTTWDVYTAVNNGRFSISTGAGFLPSTVWCKLNTCTKASTSDCEKYRT